MQQNLKLEITIIQYQSSTINVIMISNINDH